MMRTLRSLQNKLRQAGRLSLAEWGDLTHAWFLILAVDLGLRTLPFLKLQKLLKTNGMKNADGDPWPEIQSMNRLVDIASRNHLYKMTCLRQALTLQRLLAKKGIATDLKIGVLKGLNGFEAHAWLEKEGQPIGQQGLVKRFVPMNRIPCF